MTKHGLGNRAKNSYLGGHTLGVQVGARTPDHHFCAALCRASRRGVT